MAPSFFTGYLVDFFIYYTLFGLMMSRSEKLSQKHYCLNLRIFLNTLQKRFAYQCFWIYFYKSAEID